MKDTIRRIETLKYTASIIGQYTDAIDKFIAGITDLNIDYQVMK